MSAPQRTYDPPSGWVRVNRRTGPYGDVTTERHRGRRIEVTVKQRVPGPWHAQWTTRQTWCGRQPAKMLSASFHKGTEPPAGDKVCPDCTRAIAEGRPRPNSNRGQRGA